MLNSTARAVRRHGKTIKKGKPRSSVRVTFNRTGSVSVKPATSEYRKSRKPYSRETLRRYVAAAIARGNEPRHPLIQRPLNNTELRRINRRFVRNATNSNNSNNEFGDPKAVSIYVYETPNNADEAGRVHFVTFPSRHVAMAVATELHNLNFMNMNFMISNNGKTLTFPYAATPANAQNIILDALSGTGGYNIYNNNSNFVWGHNGNGHDVLRIYRGG